MISIQNQPIQIKQITDQWFNSQDAQKIVHSIESSQTTYHYQHMDSLKFEVIFRKYIIQSAVELSNSHVSFATFYYSRCNSNFWSLSNEGGFSLKTNIQPSDGIMDIFKHSRQYAFECATAMMIILYRAYIYTLDENTFNRRFHSLYLWDWHANKNFPIHTYNVNEGIPGDVRYFKNPDVNPKTPQWQGENTIQLYDNMYYGHGVGINNEQGIIDELNTHRKLGASQTPYLMKRATRPVFNILDKNFSREYSSDKMVSIKVGCALS